MKHQEFKAMAQGIFDYEVDVFPVGRETDQYGTMMVIGAAEGAIYITKAQAMAFWGLVNSDDWATR